MTMGSTRLPDPKRLLALVVVAFLNLIAPALAHEVRPAYLQIDQTDTNRYTVLWKTPLLSGMPLPVILKLPDSVTHVMEPQERPLPGFILQKRLISAPDSLAGLRLEFIGLQATITDVLIRITWLDGRQVSTIIRPSQPWYIVPAEQTSWSVAWEYLKLGIRHILYGLDHLLFVASLMLIVRDWRVLVKTITAFTVAHSITLALATFGLVTLPGPPVEAMVALSILLVAAEAVRMERGEKSLTITWPWVVAFGFGLLHGFGFAGAMIELGLPQRDIPLALLFFNVGVEIGQLAFIAAILAVVYAARLIFTFGRPMRVAAAYGVGAVAAFWTVDRLSAIFL
ncbi:HupE/UreJ family protein [Chelatococcus sp.]|uniref:HupE/UreJ family protein n=2 Tax=Chelatococcus TaxID=28209 RepID=UPI001BCFC362|nr:HupE/UreJ family protein [Chelatococcus sp.]MBS7739101.1 HupE/UreJ family protein [Chelatococcus sp. HY11]CAH1671252.1 HupE / UreJ protein [Hyphomicrobiales bacterium]MBX3543536.1 HupE/UreJ family protein [Chelatococcus sp.]MCO5076369.1 HupE/UreJ family protein [Chelatococcus sp.]CAH1676552.1 HupE / UreJ protein [Hyphomicrobiales bacterium]